MTTDIERVEELLGEVRDLVRFRLTETEQLRAARLGPARRIETSLEFARRARDSAVDALERVSKLRDDANSVAVFVGKAYEELEELVRVLDGTIEATHSAEAGATPGTDARCDDDRPEGVAARGATDARGIGHGDRPGGGGEQSAPDSASPPSPRTGGA